MQRVIVFLVLVLCGMIWLSDVAEANESPSWVSGPASMTRSVPAYVQGNGECAGYSQQREIQELGEFARVCFSGDDRMRFGYFSTGGPYSGAVQFPMSDEVHVLEGVCAGVACHYTAENDMLVTLQPVAQGYRGVVVYLRASERVSRVQSAGGSARYIFDSTSPDYAVRNKEGQFMATPTLAVSQNGKWIAVELRNAGTAVINTDTFTLRQVITDGYAYGYGMNPSEQLAISNDGDAVAVMGENAGFRVIEKVEGCGQELSGNGAAQPLMFQCPSSDLAIASHFPNFHSAIQPRFFGKGQQLEVVVRNWVDPSRRVTFLASGAEVVPRLKLLTLGDSFTSGEGETSKDKYRFGTNEGHDTCHVSDRSYPVLVANAIGYSSDSAKTVACAGATTRDIIGSRGDYWGQGGRLGERGMNLSPAERNSTQEDATYSFQPGRTLQSAFIEKYSPEKLIIGIGGNDAGLMGKLSACAMPGTCEWATSAGLRATASEIRRLYPTLGALFSYTKNTLPETQVYVVGYPRVINATGQCDLVTATLFDSTERIFIQKSIEYLNQIIRAAANDAGFTYLDIENSMDGKQLCNGEQSTAMNGLVVGGDISIIESLPMAKVIGSESFHPTPIGHDLVASTILAQQPGLNPTTACVVDPMSCGGTFVSTEPPVYWGLATNENILAYASNFATQPADDQYQVAIDIPDGTLAPGSAATIIVRSEEVLLDSVTMNAKGGYVGGVVIPSNIQHGFHTMHFIGQNRAGAEVDMYQVVSVGVNQTEGNTEELSENAVNQTNDDRAPLVATAVTDSPSISVVTAMDDGEAGMAVLGERVQVAAISRTTPASVAPLHESLPLNTSVVYDRDAHLVFWVIVVSTIATGIAAAILFYKRWEKLGT
jgi:hypothetical protein